MMGTRSFVVLIATAFACGPSIGDDGGGMDGDGTGFNPGGPDADDDADPPTPDPPVGSLGMDHGVVTISFKWSQTAESDPYAGTASVRITLLYLDCLVDFYAANPSWRQDGPDGSAVFAAALGTGMCDSGNPGWADCTVTNIQQDVDGTQSMTVEHQVSGSVSDLLLPFGPLPSATLAACAEGGVPIVRIASTQAVQGFDASGALIWTIEAFSPPEATTDQGAPLTIRATRI